jgi:hypothetical protein
LFEADIENEKVRVVKAYYPSAEEWDDNFKTRRSRS